MNYLCPKELAAQLGISDRTARRLMSDAKIPSFRVGPRLWRTTQGHVDAYIRAQFGRYRRAPLSVTEVRAA